MGPKHGSVCSVFERTVIGVPENTDVAMPRRAFGTKSLKGVFGVNRVASQCGLDFLVYHDINLYASFGLALQDLVEAVFLIVIGGSAQEQLWGEPPIGNVN